MPRAVIDTSVWFRGESCTRTILGLGAGIAEGLWSAQIVGELTRTRLWVGKMERGRRLPSSDEYLEYRRRQYELIDAIDKVCGLARPTGVTPDREEIEWSRGDPDDLHVQLLARANNADYVVSLNTNDFPNAGRHSGMIRGQLSGVIWITPEALF